MFEITKKCVVIELSVLILKKYYFCSCLFDCWVIIKYSNEKFHDSILQNLVFDNKKIVVKTFLLQYHY